MSFVSNLFFSVEEIGACRELSFARQGSQVSCFLVAFECSWNQGITIEAEIQIFVRFEVALILWQWSSHVSRMCI